MYAAFIIISMIALGGLALFVWVMTKNTVPLGSAPNKKAIDAKLLEAQRRAQEEYDNQILPIKDRGRKLDALNRK
jgi:hypothetical protein